MEMENKLVAIKEYIEGHPSETAFEIRSVPFSLTVPEGSNGVVVKNLYVSIDPYQINRAKKYYNSSQSAISASTRLIPGQVIDAFGVGIVEASANPGFEKGDIVFGVFGWSQYSFVQEGSILRKIESREFPFSYHLGILGFSGLAAYAGFYIVCKPKKGEKVFVSAASGSVGNVVGQYAKLFGCYVVGCAGTKQKVDLLKEKLGFDDAFNYNEQSDLKLTLKRYFPDGIDIYFDNVGGEILEAAVGNMNTIGRVAACGVISEYTKTGRQDTPDMIDVVYKRITIQGFLTIDYMDDFQSFISTASDYLRSGAMHVVEDISQGLESIPTAFCGLFRGDNVGKKLVQVSDE